jgi:phytoene synthase
MVAKPLQSPAGHAMPELSYCARETRRHDPDRFLCVLFAPAETREALFGLCAFSREIARVGEVVSERLLGRLRLKWWRDALDGAYAGDPPAHPIARALADAVRRFGVSRPPFERMLEARWLDLDGGPPRDMAALLAHAEGTSSTLVRLQLEVLGAGDPDSLAAGDAVGVAWALAGLMRAVPFHAGRGRLYLPEALCREVGLDPAAAYDPGARPRLAEAVRRVAAVAESRLADARARRARLPRRGLPALLPGVLADVYLVALRRAGFDPFQPRMNAPRSGRMVRLAWQAFRGRY